MPEVVVVTLVVKRADPCATRHDSIIVPRRREVVVDAAHREPRRVKVERAVVAVRDRARRDASELRGAGLRSGA